MSRLNPTDAKFRQGSKLRILAAIACLSIALPAQGNQFKLSWTPNREPMISHYLVFRDTLGAPEAVVATVYHPRHTFIDTDVRPGVRYYYRLKAVNRADSASAYSATVSAAIPRVRFPEGLDTLLLNPGSLHELDLDPYLQDPDNTPEQIAWSAAGNISLAVQIDPQQHRARILAPANWRQRESLVFTARDPGGFAGSDTIVVTAAQISANPATEIIVFPVPYRPAEHQQISGISFSGLPAGATLTIYNFLGEPVFLRENLEGGFIWDTRNRAGEPAVSGLYLYRVTGTNGSLIADGKLVIIR